MCTYVQKYRYLSFKYISYCFSLTVLWIRIRIQELPNTNPDPHMQI